MVAVCLAGTGFGNAVPLRRMIGFLGMDRGAGAAFGAGLRVVSF